MGEGVGRGERQRAEGSVREGKGKEGRESSIEASGGGQRGRRVGEREESGRLCLCLRTRRHVCETKEKCTV